MKNEIYEQRIVEFSEAHKQSTLSQDESLYEGLNKALIEILNDKRLRHTIVPFIKIEMETDRQKALMFQCMVDYIKFLTSAMKGCL